MRISWLAPVVLFGACEPSGNGEADDASALRGVAVDASDSGVSLLWNTYSPDAPYDPRSVSVVEQDDGFVLELESELPESARFPVEGPSGVQEDPDAALVGVARVYLTAEGAIENNRDGVIAMDLDAVIGWDEAHILAYWPTDLESLEGIRYVQDDWDVGLEAGYHLIDASLEAEVPLDTELHAEIGPVGD